MQSSYLCFHYVLCEKRGWKYYITPPPPTPGGFYDSLGWSVPLRCWVLLHETYY